jgi:enamine deaminase RidA (YjgF/YER057c/UK114 family)
MTIERHETGPRMSQCVVHNDVVYLAGQVDAATSPTASEQTKEILQRIDTLLEMAGTDKSKLLTASIWLSDIRYFSEMNEVWDAWVSPGNAPTRACVEARLASPAFLVEIRVTAAR